jgi:hypothetical protein
VGTTYIIQWTSSGVTSQRVQYSIDNGANFIAIQTGLGPTIQQFAWIIPSGIVPTGQNSIAAIIRVVVRDANGVEAISGSNVIIANAQITSITPNHGPIAGNTLVDIAGQGFDPQVNVKFGTLDATITQTSPTLIKVKTPAVTTAGAVEVKVKNPAVPGVSGVFTYDPPALPTITSISPNHGPITGNTEVSIAGANFDSQVNVKFGEVDGLITQKSATLIKVNSPAVTTPGAVQLKVKNPGVEGATTTFTYDPLPRPLISNVDPAHGPITGNTPVTITGSNFDPQVNVKFGEIDAVITQKSATQIKVNSPAVTTPGAVQLKVKNPGVEAVTANFTYDALPRPTISNVDPVHGPITGNTPVTITGTNFDPQVTVKFGEIDAVITQKSATLIKVNTPAVTTPGAVQLKVKNPGVEAATATFTYDPPAGPMISNVDPIRGPITGNTLVTIIGSNFDPQVNVKFGEIDGVITQKSATLIKVNSPAVTTPGAVQLKIKNPGVEAVVATFTYDPLPRPMITNVDPLHGPIAGNTMVTITGSNFDPQVTVKFGEIDAVITQKSATLIKVNSPAVTTPGAVQLKVKNPGVEAATATFTYDPLPPPDAPRIDGINPAVGPVTRSIPVVITGANFVNGCQVFFGGANAQSVTFNGANQLTVQTPKDVAAGRVRVKVVNPDQTSGKRDDGFEFVAAPVVLGTAPPEGPREGNITVKILGMNFQQGATVRFGNTSSLDTPVVNPDGTSITCLLPPGDKGSVTVKVMNPAPDLQQGKLDNGFLYLGPQQEDAARIFSISPKTVLLNTGTPMKVRGRNLSTAISQGTFGVRGPNSTFASVTMTNLQVQQLQGTQDELVTFVLTISRSELSITQRVPYYVVASVRPKSRDDRIFEASRNAQFTLVTNSSPLAFGVTAELIEGAANMILLSGRGLNGASLSLTDSSGTSMPFNYIDDREDLLIAGITVEENMSPGGMMLRLLDRNQQPVGDPIPLEVMPGSPPNDDNNDAPVGRLKVVPGQKVMTVPDNSVGVFAFASSSGGSWLPEGGPLFPLGDVGYEPVLVENIDFGIVLVNQSLVVPSFGRTAKPSVGVVGRVRGVPLIIHLEIALFVVIRVYVFSQGNPFPNFPVGAFNEFPELFPDAFGTYLVFISVSVRDLDIGYLVALVAPDDTLELLVGNLTFSRSNDRRQLTVGGVMLSAHINSIRPLGGASNLLLAAPAITEPPIKDPASFLGFFFPTEPGRACIDWEFRVVFTNRFLDGTPVEPDGQGERVFLVRICTRVIAFPSDSLKIRIEPPFLDLNEGEQGRFVAKDQNNIQLGVPSPVHFEPDAAAAAIADLVEESGPSDALVTAKRDIQGSGSVRAMVKTAPGFSLFPDPGYRFSFSAPNTISVEVDSAQVNVAEANNTSNLPLRGRIVIGDELGSTIKPTSLKLHVSGSDSGTMNFLPIIDGLDGSKPKVTEIDLAAKNTVDFAVLVRGERLDGVAQFSGYLVVTASWNHPGSDQTMPKTMVAPIYLREQLVTPPVEPVNPFHVVILSPSAKSQNYVFTQIQVSGPNSGTGSLHVRLRDNSGSKVHYRAAFSLKQQSIFAGQESNPLFSVPIDVPLLARVFPDDSTFVERADYAILNSGMRTDAMNNKKPPVIRLQPTQLSRPEIAIAGKTLVLDPGHGLNYEATDQDRPWEWWIAHRICDAIATRWRARGGKVFIMPTARFRISDKDFDIKVDQVSLQPPLPQMGTDGKYPFNNPKVILNIIDAVGSRVYKYTAVSATLREFAESLGYEDKSIAGNVPVSHGQFITDYPDLFKKVLEPRAALTPPAGYDLVPGSSFYEPQAMEYQVTFKIKKPIPRMPDQKSVALQLKPDDFIILNSGSVARLADKSIDLAYGKILQAFCPQQNKKCTGPGPFAFSIGEPAPNYPVASAEFRKYCRDRLMEDGRAPTFLERRDYFSALDATYSPALFVTVHLNAEGTVPGTAAGLNVLLPTTIDGSVITTSAEQVRNGKRAIKYVDPIGSGLHGNPIAANGEASQTNLNNRPNIPLAQIRPRALYFELDFMTSAANAPGGIRYGIMAKDSFTADNQVLTFIGSAASQIFAAVVEIVFARQPDQVIDRVRFGNSL